MLGVYIALSAACGLYLLGVYRLPHDHGASETLSVPRLLFSIAFLGLALYLLPGLFKTADGEQQRPQGTVFAWLDSFLLPEDAGPVAGPARGPAGAASGRLAWVGDLEQGLKQGAAEKKLVFLDFTAHDLHELQIQRAIRIHQAGGQRPAAAVRPRPSVHRQRAAGISLGDDRGRKP